MAGTPVLPIRGDRCILRTGRQEDGPVVREWARPHHDWHRWDGPYFPRPTDAEAEAFAEALANQPADAAGSPPPHRAVVADAATDRLIGTVSWYWESEATQWARMGITLYDPRVRGRGAGREALRMWTSYLFGRTDWVRLDLATWSGNTAMMTVAGSLGFVEEARFRQARVVDGARYDSVAYGVLRDEWFAVRPPTPTG